jgi:hypothetical protein
MMMTTMKKKTDDTGSGDGNGEDGGEDVLMLVMVMT